MFQTTCKTEPRAVGYDPAQRQHYAVVDAHTVCSIADPTTGQPAQRHTHTRVP
jgi:hypothetical protein